MASNTLGRVVCPIGCGHNAAQVKIKTDKASGTAYPYVHCAGCGIQLHTRNEEQARYLLANTRKEKGVDPVPATPAAPPSPDPAPVEEIPPAPPKKAPGALFPMFAGG